MRRISPHQLPPQAPAPARGSLGLWAGGSPPRWSAALAKLEFDSRICGFGVGELKGLWHARDCPDEEDITLGSQVVSAVVNEAARMGMRLVVARIGAGDTPGARALERAGFELADISVRWQLTLTGELPKPELPGGLAIRPWEPGDLRACQELVAESMCDPLAFPTRLCTDPALAPFCKEIHYQWVANCFSGQRADWGVVLCAPEGIIGCCLVRRLSQDQGWVEINALARHWRGKGLYKAVLIPALRWLRSQGITTAGIKTKLSQRAVVRTWAGLGGRQVSEEIAMHWWREP